MKTIVEELLTKQKNVMIDIYQLEKQVKERLGERRINLFYKEFGETILVLENEKKVEKVKTSKPYSRDLRIQTKYKKAKATIDNEQERKNELLTSFHIQMKMGGYLANLIQYEKDKMELAAISDFLGSKSEKECYLSVNERSFELFGNEKFLSSKSGKKLLGNIGMTYEDLFCFETYEPFFHYGLAQRPKDNILIIENKDTFFSLKKLFLEGYTSWFGVPFEMLVYGEGNKITKSIDYLEELSVPSETQIYYFGDFDPEGITIFHRIREKSDRNISLWEPLYIELWKRKRGSKLAKEQYWNETAIQSFLQFFDVPLQREMENYLKQQRYIPQEAVHINLLRSLSDGIN